MARLYFDPSHIANPGNGEEIVLSCYADVPFEDINHLRGFQIFITYNPSQLIGPTNSDFSINEVFPRDRYIRYNSNADRVEVHALTPSGYTGLFGSRIHLFDVFFRINTDADIQIPIEIEFYSRIQGLPPDDTTSEFLRVFSVNDTSYAFIIESAPKALADTVYNRYTAFLQRPIIRALIPTVLQGLRVKTIRELLTSENIETVADNPQLLLGVVSNVNQAQIDLLTSDQEMRAFIRDADVQSLLITKDAFEYLGTLVDSGNISEPVTESEPLSSDAQTLAVSVFENYESLLRGTLGVRKGQWLEELLVGLVHPEVQALLDENTIQTAIDNPDILLIVIPTIDPAFVAEFKTNIDLQEMLANADVIKLLQNVEAIHHLGLLLDVPEPTETPEEFVADILPPNNVQTDDTIDVPVLLNQPPVTPLDPEDFEVENIQPNANESEVVEVIQPDPEDPTTYIAKVEPPEGEGEIAVKIPEGSIPLPGGVRAPSAPIVSDPITYSKKRRDPPGPTGPFPETPAIRPKQIVIAHWLGSEQDEAVTRCYFLDADDSWVSSHRGRILYIAGENGKYFIDLKSNIRYDWDFSALHITDIVAPSPSDTRLTQFNRLSADLLIAFAANRTHRVFSEFPGSHDGELRFITITSVPYAFKVTYSASDIGFEGPSSPHLIGFLTPDIRKADIYKWIYKNRQALRDNILTTSFDDDDKTFIETIQNQPPTTVFVDKENLPDWKDINLQLEVYAAELPEALFTLEGTTITITDEIAVQALPDSEYVRVGKVIPDRQAIQGVEVSLIPTEDEVFYLDAQFNYPPPDNLYAITEHAGRIYGVNRDTQEVIFSHINGQGVSNRWVFPPHNAFPTDASGVSPIQALEQMPNRGGLYVFKRDAIHYIDGQNIFAGLYSISVGTTTDISAADYKKNIGCISRRSIENDGSGVLFVGSDEQIYMLTGKDATPIGVTIKPFIRDIPIDALKSISTEWYNQKFYIALPDSTLVLNTEHKYWTRYDWVLSDMFWSRGGKDAESIFYGLQSDNTLLELNVDTDDKFPILWEANKQIRDTGSLLTGVMVYTENGEEVTITVNGNEPPSEVSRTFTPKLSNKYRAGCHVKGRNIDVKIESEKPITIDRIDLEETI